MIIAAIDIGTNKIAGAVASKTEAGTELLAFNKEECKPGSMKHGNAASKDNVTFHLNSVLKKLGNEAGVRLAKCFISYAGQGLLAKKPEYDNVMKSCIEQINNNGIELKRISDSPVKLTADIILNENEKQNGCLFIDLGRGTTSSLVYENGIVKLANTRPAGTDYFFLDLMAYISQDLGLENFSENKCSKLLSKFGNAMPDGQLVSIRLAKPIEGKPDYLMDSKILNDILLARLEKNLIVIQKLKAEEWFDNKDHNIVVCGGGSRLRNIGEYISERSGLTVRQAIPDNIFIENELAKRLYAPEYCTLAAMLATGREDCIAETKQKTETKNANKKRNFFDQWKRISIFADEDKEKFKK